MAKEKNDQTTQRVIQVPLVGLKDTEWRHLRRLAYVSAQFGNCLLTESYAKAKTAGLARADGEVNTEIAGAVEALFKQLFHTYTDFNTQLSASIRDAVSRECVGFWRRLGKKILRGEQTLGRFSADRALVCRERGIKLERTENERDGKTYQGIAVTLRLDPMPAEPTILHVYMPALVKDKFKRELLNSLLENPECIRKATICFKRPGTKVFLLLTYTKPLVAINRPGDPALVSVLSDGSCWVRVNGRSLSLANRVYHLIHMKEHFARIQGRIRAHLGKRGHRYEARKKLASTGNFGEWSVVPLHQFSRELVDFCHANLAGAIHWQIDPGAPELPWDKLKQMVTYKAEEIGLTLEVVKPEKTTNENPVTA